RFVKLRRRHDLHQSKMPLIFEHQPAVVKIKYRVRKFRIGCRGVKEHKTSAHPQMRYQGIAAAESKKYMFAAPFNRHYPRIPEPAGERARIRIRHECFAATLGETRRPSRQSKRQVASYEIDLGQFRHN